MARTKSERFAEEPKKFEYEQPLFPSSSQMGVRATLGAGGRLVIPAELRALMEFSPGDAAVLRVVDGVLHVISGKMVMKRVQAEAEKFKARNPGVSVVDELIAERRAEAARDTQEANAWRKKHGLPLLDGGE
ncbi:AbrB/MazE/SpoVT family DNA-binding domain-containing protein [Phyllobacterium zundukense]|uniref:AbrB/MazE/SpoVT family DNA-binding domain-containing protein n=1 Tax=Phyllobacterium zundukense TaxID=1867719 RepID=UPI001951F74A|nr:AbrB/MazE/SpoVT family DNA-binding domain-containing protein [Phyllobacterium zundukense]